MAIHIETSDLFLDLVTLEEYADGVRMDMAEHAEKLGLKNLAKACLVSSSVTDIHDEAYLDLVKLSHQKLLDVALPAGVILGEMTRLIKSVAQAALSPEIDDDQ